jgi:6-pyruvoyltetrahydropterin/6-carboxytetrahydropterin synthase
MDRADNQPHPHEPIGDGVPAPVPRPAAAHEAMAAGTERWGIKLDKQYFNFAAAHFLIFADGTREELHGHNYRATLEIDADLDEAHLVADFIEVKPVFRAACDSLDHRTILPLRNRYLQVEPGEREVVARFGEDRWVFPRRDVILLDIENTASELLARELCRRFLAGLGDKLPSLRMHRVLVTVQESPGQAAVYERVFTKGIAR